MPRTVKEMYGYEGREGEVGIEIEMEGVNLPPIVPHDWKAVREGSCRGESLEYVLKYPVLRAHCRPSLLSLHNTLTTTKGCVLTPSERCGIHIHLNAHSLTYDQVIVWACLYLLFEGIMVKWCGEEREGNLFCLRSEDADYIIDRIIHSLQFSSFKDSFQFNGMRYASVNFEAINKYGSLEFRSMRTVKDFVDPICTWINGLLAIKDTAASFENVSDIVAQFSKMGPEAFAKDVLKQSYEDFYCPNMDNMLYDSVRRVQDVAFAVELNKQRLNKEIKKTMIKKIPEEKIKHIDFVIGDFNLEIENPVVWKAHPRLEVVDAAIKKIRRADQN